MADRQDERSHLMAAGLAVNHGKPNSSNPEVASSFASERVAVFPEQVSRLHSRLRLLRPELTEGSGQLLSFRVWWSIRESLGGRDLCDQTQPVAGRDVRAKPPASPPCVVHGKW